MKNNLSLLVFVMDRCGSMYGIIDETIKGFNSLIEEQKKEEENGLEAKVTVAIFDEKYDLIHNYIDIKEIPELTKELFFARGWTALQDAIGKTIVDVGKALKDLPEEDRPSKVLFTVFTDGEENSSREYTGNKIKELIKHQEDKYNWKFNFIGANIDSYAMGSSLGVNIANTANYTATSKGVKTMMSGVSAFYSASRSIDPDTIVSTLDSYVIEDNDAI
jgi:uncharacterized protein YegL